MNNLLSISLYLLGSGIILISIYCIIKLFRSVHKYHERDKFDELFIKIKEEIKSSIVPKFMTVTVEANEIIDLAIEIWRIEQRISKSATNLPENQLKGLENSIQKMKRYLEKYDIEVIDYKNNKYNDGLNLDILSVEKDQSLQEPMVKETVEPTVMLKGQVVRKAKIILLTNH